MSEKELHSNKFIQTNSPDGGFLQSEAWRRFQENVGRKTFNISGDSFWANIIEHELPVVGKYFYIPRGPVFCHPELVSGSNKLDSGSEAGMRKVLELAKKENASWIRFDANNLYVLNLLGSEASKWECKIRKAPHDMQPRELFIVGISKSEEELLGEMKSKTRYNIKLAQKHGVTILVTRNLEPVTQKKYIEKFIEMVRVTAKRDKITPHPDEYYRKMFEAIPPENIRLYIAEYENKIIAASIVVFYGKVATYLHGASDHSYRNFMAPYLLQWQAILDAKKAGCNFYDLGGIKTCNMKHKTCSKDSWGGITRFKTGFSLTAKPIEFPGSYDIVLKPFRYNLYRILQSIKALF